jgi:hypothetical protein
MENEMQDLWYNPAPAVPCDLNLNPGLFRRQISSRCMHWLMHQFSQLSQKLGRPPCGLLPSGLL